MLPVSRGEQLTFASRISYVNVLRVFIGLKILSKCPTKYVFGIMATKGVKY